LKLLFLANRTPYPPFRGDKLKIWHLAKRLAAKGHELHLLTFAQSKEDYAAREILEGIFAEVHLIDLPSWKSALHCLSAAWDPKPIQVLYFQDKAMERKLQEVLSKHQFHAVHVQHLRMAPYLAESSTLPRILDLPDAFSLYWRRRKKIPKNFLRSAFENLESKRVLEYEPVLKSFTLALTCSREDLQYLEQTHKASNLRLLPNGVDLDTFYPRSHDYTHGHTLLFTGNMDYAPNVDAVQYFCNELLPEIQRQMADVKLIIAGQRPVEAVRKLASGCVTVTGFVPDIAEMYNQASIVIAPLRFGAGTQNKVLEAMAMGIPVVCSDIGFAGLGIQQGEGAFMQTEGPAFIQQVLDLMQNQSLREETGKRGITIMKANFGWDAITNRLEGYFEEAVGAVGSTQQLPRAFRPGMNDNI